MHFNPHMISSHFRSKQIFAGDSETDRTHRRSTVTLGIRKVQFAPSKSGSQPCTIVRKDFMLSPGELELEVTLDKQLYFHEERISVNICVRNNSNKVNIDNILNS